MAIDLATGTEKEANISDRYLYLMIGRFLAPYWKSLVAVGLMLIGVTIISLLPPYLIQRVVDGPIADGNLDDMIPFAMVYLLAIPLLFALRFGHVYLVQTVGQNALTNLRQELFEHIIRQDMRFFNKTPVGQLIARMSHDIESLTEVLSTSIVVVISNLITLVGIIFVMLSLNWRMALISLAVIPLMSLMTFYFRTRIRRHTRKLHALVGEYQSFVNEQCNGMTEVQLFGRQDISRQEFDQINSDYRDVFEQTRDLYTYFSSGLQMFTAIGMTLVLVGGGIGVVNEWATIGMVIAFIQYTQQSFVPILELSEQFAQIQSALSAGERIARMLEIEPDITDPQSIKMNNQLEHTITLDNVEFWYEEGTPVLRGISIDILAGQRVAIVGATGAGKTSLAGLIARFYDVKGGAIKIGGIDIRDLSLKQLREYVMVVPQTPYCFNGTIRDNLTLFQSGISDDILHNAAQIARSAQFIERLPDQYDHELLPGAANLSQGQRQLLALTRALIHNPDSILVLDEATSNIDTETEAMIQEGLTHILKNRTSITIAHRLSTIRDSDRILVMKDGEIIEDGNHISLLAQGGAYAQLVQEQFAETNLETEH